MAAAHSVGDFRPQTQVAIDVTRQALALALSLDPGANVTFKGVRDPVTATDLAVEDLVRSQLTARLSLNVVGEERGGERTEAPYWLVDPICGTRNYASGMTLYCINIALVENNLVTAAVVGDPSTGDILFAERNGGAWALRAKTIGRLTADTTSEIVIVDDGSAAGFDREQAARVMAEVVRANRWHFRSFGTSLPAAYVAAARASAYVCFHIRGVHAAAGALLAAESGATVTDIHGFPWNIYSRTMLVATAHELHRELLSMVFAART